MPASAGCKDGKASTLVEGTVPPTLVPRRTAAPLNSQAKYRGSVPLTMARNEAGAPGETTLPTGGCTTASMPLELACWRVGEGAP